MSTDLAKLHQNIMYYLQTWPAVMFESMSEEALSFLMWTENASVDSTEALGLTGASLSWVGFPGPRTRRWDLRPQSCLVSWGWLFIKWSSGVGMRKDKGMILQTPQPAGLPETTTKGAPLELTLKGKSSHGDLVFPIIKNGSIIAPFSSKF